MMIVTMIVPSDFENHVQYQALESQRSRMDRVAGNGNLCVGGNLVHVGRAEQVQSRMYQRRIARLVTDRSLMTAGVEKIDCRGRD